MSVSWSSFRCPVCGVENFFYDGDLDDVTVPDPNPMLRCMKCDYVWVPEEYLADPILLECNYGIGKDEEYATVAEWIAAESASAERGSSAPRSADDETVKVVTLSNGKKVLAFSRHLKEAVAENCAKIRARLEREDAEHPDASA